MKILSYIDGLSDLDSLKIFFSQVKNISQGDISLVHIIPEDNSSTENNADYSLAMQPNNRTALMHKLADLDAEKNKINNARAHIIMDHAAEYLAEYHVQPELKRGDFMALIKKYASLNDILVFGKTCEHYSSYALTHITHALEPILHMTDKPILVLDKFTKPISKAVFAFDGSENTLKALSFLAQRKFSNFEEIQIISVNMDDAQKLQAEHAEKHLSDAGYKTVLTFKEGKVFDVIENMVDSSDADLLVAGAYGHSKLRHFFLGSTTNKLLKELDKPILLF